MPKKRGKGKPVAAPPPTSIEASYSYDTAGSATATSSQARSSSPSSGTPSEQLAGHRVVLGGLQAKPQLNGATGQVIAFDEIKGRHCVVLDSQGGEAGNILVKPDNLTRATGEPAWRAQDSFFHDELARVTPAVEGWHEIKGTLGSGSDAFDSRFFVDAAPPV